MKPERDSRGDHEGNIHVTVKTEEKIPNEEKILTESERM